MENLHRRTIMAAGTALVAGGSLASIGAGEDDCRCVPGVEEPATGWSSYGGNPANGRYVPADDGIDKPDTVAWTYDETGDLAVVDGTVYLRTNGDSPEIHAIDDTNGDVKWINDDISAEGTPAFADGSLYVSVGNQLTALDASDGTVEWTRDFGSASVPNPTVTHGRVYVVLDRTVYALDPRDGSTDWKRESVPVEVDTKPDVDSTTAEFKESISVATESVFALAEPDEGVGVVPVALEPRTGDVQWKTHLDHPGSHSLDFLMASANAVYVDGTMASSFLFDAETGEHEDLGSTCCASVATAGEIRVDAREVQLVIERYDGESIEMLWTLGSRQATVQTMIVGNTLLVRTEAASQAATNRELAAYDLETGDKRWEISPDDELNISGILAANSDTVYTRTEDHTLRALRSSEAQDGDADGDGSDGGDDGDQNDGGSDDGSNETDDGSGDGDSSDDGNDTGNADRSNDGADGDGSESDDGDGSTEGGADADGDGQPGFTPIASLAAGALGLEWLRRRALGDGDEIERQ